MKKLFFTLAIALGVATAATAQDAGKMWVGGTVGISSVKYGEGDSKLSYKVLPEFGYIISDNLAVGVSVGAGHTHSEAYLGDGQSAAAGEKATNFYKVSPFLRYTFCKGDIGGLFVDGGFGYTWGKGVNKSAAHNHEWNVGIKPGVAINVSNSVSLLGKFGFLGYSYEKADKRKEFGLDLDMRQVELGVNFKF